MTLSMTIHVTKNSNGLMWWMKGTPWSTVDRHYWRNLWAEGMIWSIWWWTPCPAETWWLAAEATSSPIRKTRSFPCRDGIEPHLLISLYASPICCDTHTHTHKVQSWIRAIQAIRMAGYDGYLTNTEPLSKMAFISLTSIAKSIVCMCFYSFLG